MPGTNDSASSAFNLIRTDISRHTLNTAQKATMIPTSNDSMVTLPREQPQRDT